MTICDLYRFYESPEELDGWDRAHLMVPCRAFIFCVKNFHLGRFPEAEKAIAKSAYDSIIYAKYTLKDRFLEGESAIMKNGHLYGLIYLNSVVRPNYGRTNPHFVDQMEHYIKTTLSLTDVNGMIISHTRV